ncbi:hypothetical protein AGMMS5026_06860 [Endomicrobiia bacterium]|nr:hypothetical protein AGMMS49523_02940 [Endomicrobiia bacterium]GHT12080.1 hypothetical protein AGMMS49571_03450 [Endomicrobiia bacterium]GHT20989.1 hypothetical protein AGMMS49929_08880 [Endomicrobiia bacterium]GHT26049.1 hypothetical protein AGMMS49995_01750 [Endomicrobiia bacterium]GHT31084.1 hypothetical protein AGMMS5026_06860 [Endomicrobiia bacterium]
MENIVVAKVRSPKNPLFSEQNRNKWGNFFRDKAKDLLKWGFAKNSSREILILYDRCTSIVRIYAMKEVLSKLSTEIRLTKGFNIGECVSFQRKGGNGYK